jgi:conjugative relaxase-like TrwC/TraI family protein
MLTLSKPISAGQAQAYHKSEFANAKENYYTEGERVRGEWQGQLAARYGLKGEVNEEQFARLSEGQHPQTGEALIRRQQAHEYVNAQGETVRAMEHRAGWDATFSAPKSVSLTALVGGDNRVREAHRESVRVALDEMEKYAQARIGGNAPPETTGAWAVARFEHDSSRPVDGYAAPQLHTHAVIFNVTETAEGKTRSLQAQELYKTQQYATAVYRSELAAHLQRLGYRSRARRAWSAGDQRLHAGVSGGIESAASADRTTACRAGTAGSWSGADRRAPDAGRQAAVDPSRRSGCSIKNSPPSMEISRSG